MHELVRKMRFEGPHSTYHQTKKGVLEMHVEGTYWWVCKRMIYETQKDSLSGKPFFFGKHQVISNIMSTLCHRKLYTYIFSSKIEISIWRRPLRLRKRGKIYGNRKIHCSGEIAPNCAITKSRIRNFQIWKMWCINVGGSVIRLFSWKASISLSLKRYQDAGNNDLSLGGPPLLGFIRGAFWKKTCFQVADPHQKRFIDFKNKDPL